MGRLLCDAQLVCEDQLASLCSARGHGDGEQLNFALLLDGLQAEREQGITIDVAHRFFSTPKRKFIVADAPGHDEYTRNMATGASTADLAVIVVDIRQGILRQTKRHTHLLSLLGIRHIVLAVNKMDLVGYSESQYLAVLNDFRAFTETLGFATVDAIPMSARFGDNVVFRSENIPWYAGSVLLEYLEDFEACSTEKHKVPRFPVQLVIRPHSEFRGYAGRVASGTIRVGDPVVVAKSGSHSSVAKIVTADGDVLSAREGDAVTLVLSDELDVSRGDILVSPSSCPYVDDHFQACLIWFDPDPMRPGRGYLLRTENDSVEVTITALKHRVDVDSLLCQPASTLEMNEIGVCNILAQRPLAFDAYEQNRSTGNFVLVDRASGATVGAGMMVSPLRRPRNIHLQSLDVCKASRAEIKGQQPAVLWFTGLSGSGKSTIANALETLLHASGKHTYILDGDNLRNGLNRDLGFGVVDRIENIRRVAEVAKLMADAGLIVICSFISPFREERRIARELMDEGEFVEIFIDTPLEECVRRDPKGLYEKALKGEITEFTGVSSPYEPPEQPELHLKTVGHEPTMLAREIESFLRERTRTHIGTKFWLGQPIDR
ncbi:bifunctional sulfate adenylyltransferase subunit 1/adenylylsulfate kinase protein, NodQ (plasmid) [Rhizobium grahamii CCGE 502]|uniref:Adenylyl-sulfate kinase n=2 Tax=Rhizobium grahamii TaxID=1120045 RepID=S3H4P6_9HYPH|nr:bifunctional sulfate adenylyltransferase subunit 1/adenylylsulfate kinase protein, NodQ [Rhizobium grahamii CCGE 502]